jgi:hypothetical protein
MPFWESRPASASNIRLLEPTIGWRSHDDVVDEKSQIAAQGSHLNVEFALHGALNANNLLLLTGAGSSFCAKNNEDGKTAPGMADLWDAVEQKVGTRHFNQIVGMIPRATGVDRNIERLLTLCKLYAALFDDSNAAQINVFVQNAEEAIVERADFVIDATDLTSHRSLIRKLARRSVRKPRAKIFTTNYDLCFEAAAREMQFVAIDGFSHSMPQTYDRAHFAHDIVRRGAEAEPPDYVESVFHLYKLHGSIDWRRKGSVLIRSQDEQIGSPVLIYPRDSKFQEAFASPYLDLMSAFQSALREPDTALIVSGFGFNDDHIAKPILAAVEANITLRVVICDVAFLKDQNLESEPPPHVVPVDAPMRTTGNVCFDRLKSLAILGDQRIALLNGRFEDLAQALPDLVAQTERERHLDRMHKLHELTGS